MPPSAQVSDDEADGESGADDEVDDDGQASDHPPQKKARGNRVIQAQKKVDEKAKQLDEAKKAVAEREAKNSKVARDIAALDRQRAKVVKFQSELGLLQTALQAAERSAAEKDALEKKREELRAQKAEETRVMSDAGVMMLVQIRLSYQLRFENRSDTTDAIWAHIHNDFMKKVTDGQLPHSDGRSVQVIRLHPLYTIPGDPHVPPRATRALYTSRGDTHAPDMKPP
jgi:hypothetical protein